MILLSEEVLVEALVEEYAVMLMLKLKFVVTEHFG